MRILSATFLALLLCALPMARAQATSNPLCSVEELDFILGNQDEFDALLAYHRRLPTLKILLEYSVALLEWRDSQAGIVLGCDEAFELGWLMSQMANDSATGAIFFLLAGVDSGNPYSAILYDRHRQRPTWLAELEAIRDSGERVDDYAARDLRLPLCQWEDLRVAGLAVDGYNDLLALAAEVESVEELVAYGEAQIAWRDAAWSNMPPCEIPRFHALDMSRVTEDLAVSIGLELAGVPAAENPYTESLAENRQYLAELEAALRGRLERERPDEAVAPPRSIDLPACPRDVVPEHLALLRDYQAQGQVAIESLADLLSFSQSQIAWRADALSTLPYCAETLEIHALLLHLNSDFVTRASLEVAGAPDSINPYWQLESDAARIEALASRLADAAAAEPGAPMRQCAVEEMQAALHENTDGYNTLTNMLGSASTSSGFGVFLEQLFSWRESLLGELTPCAEQIKFGWLMLRVQNGYAAAIGLHFAGVPAEDNPYIQSVQIDRHRLQELTLAMLRGDAAEAESSDAGSVFPLCGAAEFETLVEVVWAYQQDLSEGPPVNTLADLLDYSGRQLAWRRDQVARLPLCADVIATRLLFTQITGDFVARSALSMAGVDDADNPYLELPSDRDRLESVALAILDGQRQAGDRDAPGEIRPCSADELGQVGDITVEFMKLVQRRDGAEDLAVDLAPFADFLDWRRGRSGDLPACAVALFMLILMNERFSDKAASSALAWAGADADAIPQLHSAAERSEGILDLFLANESNAMDG